MKLQYNIKRFIKIIKLIRISLIIDNRERANKIKKMKLLNKMGKDCFIARNIYFGSEPELISLGNNVWLTSGVKLVTHDGSLHMLSKTLNKKLNPKIGEINIKDNCFIGINSIIMPGIAIGPNSIIGAGSIVTKDVPPNTIVAGNPAKKIMSIKDYLNKNKNIDCSTGLNKINHFRRKIISDIHGLK